MDPPAGGTTRENQCSCCFQDRFARRFFFSCLSSTLQTKRSTRVSGVSARLPSPNSSDQNAQTQAKLAFRSSAKVSQLGQASISM